jgi:hypothetical protein
LLLEAVIGEVVEYRCNTRAGFTESTITFLGFSGRAVYDDPSYIRLGVFHLLYTGPSRGRARQCLLDDVFGFWKIPGD